MASCSTVCFSPTHIAGCTGMVVQAELCCRVEEAMCLRARVSQLCEQLETEKRLNAAIKNKKVLPLLLLFSSSVQFYFLHLASSE